MSRGTEVEIVTHFGSHNWVFCLTGINMLPNAPSRWTDGHTRLMETFHLGHSHHPYPATADETLVTTVPTYLEWHPAIEPLRPRFAFCSDILFDTSVYHCTSRLWNEIQSALAVDEDVFHRELSAVETYHMSEIIKTRHWQPLVLDVSNYLTPSSLQLQSQSACPYTNPPPLQPS